MLLVAFPGADLGISGLFFDHGFFMADQSWTRILHASVTWFVVGSLIAVATAYAFNRMAGRKAVYLLLVLAFGGGFVVNGMLKDGFGRARPRDVAEFGGAGRFTPAFVLSSACDRNCSFSSGDSAGAFFALAFTFAGGRRRLATTAAAGYGVLVSAARIAAGAHFLSDTIVSFFVMLVVSDALHYRMFLFRPWTATAPPVFLPAPADGKPSMP